MDAFFRLLAAAPTVVTIGLWLTLAPATGAVGRAKPGNRKVGLGKS
jgi:hypothetical protein